VVAVPAVAAATVAAAVVAAAATETPATRFTQNARALRAFSVFTIRR